MISEKAVEIDWEIAFQGFSRGNRHLERTVKRAAYLMRVEQKKGRQIDEFVVLIGAWLHDIGLINGNWHHASRGKNIASAILRILGVDKSTREKIELCIYAHDAGSDAHDERIEAETIEAQIVHDADTLDKMGPLGFVRHVWKMSVDPDQHYSPEDLFSFVPRHLQERRTNLYLEASRDLTSRYTFALENFLQNKELAIEMIKRIGQEARGGKPTEKIVEELMDHFSSAFMNVLRQQIDLEWLEAID